MIPVAFAPELVEEAVLLAEPRMTPAQRGTFRRDRNRIYELPDADERETRFQALHGRWFVALGLDCGVEPLLAEHLGDPLHAPLPARCRVLPAVARQEEGADLVDRVAPDTGRTEIVLVIRLRPSTLLAPRAARSLLRHELTHVSDMLDPAFGYQRSLPPSGEGPSADAILRDRYRVLWDVTIDGRLARGGWVGGTVRQRRRQEFVDTFAMLGERGGAAFDEGFEGGQPNHARLAAYAQSPA